MPRQKLTQRTDGYFKVKYHDKQFYGKTQAEACLLYTSPSPRDS